MVLAQLVPLERLATLGLQVIRARPGLLALLEHPERWGRPEPADWQDSRGRRVPLDQRVRGASRERRAVLVQQATAEWSGLPDRVVPAAQPVLPEAPGWKV